MADANLGYQEPDTIDKLLDAESLTVGADTVYRERIQISGTGATDLAPVSATDGLLVNLGANNDVTVAGVSTAAKQDTIIGHLDGVEGLLGTIDADTGSILLAVDGIEALLTTIDTDTGSILSAVDGIEALLTTIDADTSNIATSVANIDTDTTTIIGHLDGVEGLLGTIDADTGGILTSVQLIDNAAATIGTTDVLRVALFDNANNQVTSFGGGTQYTQGDTDASITGTAMLMEGAADTLLPVQGTVADGLLVNLGSNNDVVVSATNLDIRDIDAATDDITIHGDVGIIDQFDLTNSNPAAVAIVDGNGDQITSFGGGTQYAVDAALGANPTGTLTLFKRDDALSALTPVEGDAVEGRVDANGAIHMNMSYKLDSTNDSITAVLSATDNQVLDDILADTAAIQTAVELIDNGIYVDDADWTADTSSHMLVGAVTQVATTANTDGDTTPLTTNAFRELRVAIPESDLATAGTAHVKKYYTNAGAVTDGIIWSPAAGKRWYITDIYIQTSAAATITLEDDLAAGDAAVWKSEFTANQGWAHTFQTPLFSGEDAADLLVTTTAGNVYITITGYEI